MERRVVDSLVAPKRLAYFLTFVSPSFMALHRIIIDISQNMSRGGTLSVPPLEILCPTFYTKKSA